MSAATTADILGKDRMWARDEQGERIARERKCLCGRTYTQAMLNPEFVDRITKGRPNGLAAFARQITDGYVPVWCPSCERNDLTNQAKREPIRHAGNPDYYDGDRDAAD